MVADDRVLLPWAKTGRRGNPDDYHPALFHMIDVGNVAAVLVGRDGPTRLRRVLTRALGGGEDAIARWLPLLVSLHDIGKISSPFQRQVEEQRQRLARSGIELAAAAIPSDVRHQHLSAIALDELRTQLEWSGSLWRTLSDSLAGHHGRFAAMVTLREARRFNESVERSEVIALRRVAIKWLLEVFPTGESEQPFWPENVSAATAALTGYMVLADWLGSDADVFEATPGLTVEAYLPLSRARAREVAAHAGFLGTRATPRWEGFGLLFPAIEQVTPLQAAVERLPEEVVGGPGLFIIEAPTGDGKTEAALALARRLGPGIENDELYVALPTMATSNQMFERVQRFLRRAVGADAAVKLIHGQAFLIEDDLQARTSGDATDKESPAAAAPAWFAPRKRALLAPWGVGTVDQAELAALSARHYVLRLLGLAGKVVIVDEVHAYDTYMSTVIDHVLWWLATLGTPVILLSATLPAARHRELAAAYQRGLATRQDGGTGEPELSYPLLAAYTAGDAWLEQVAAASERTLGVRFVDEVTPEEDARRLLERVNAGGAVCRITNTVGRAQRVYRALRDQAAGDSEVRVALVHARMPGDERLERERFVTDAAGPNRARTTEDRLIVVGTQVLEQSLDLDFDLMVSDLAPVDLLLQRAGRLHRHRRDWRPAGMRESVLEVVAERDDSGLPTLEASRGVYEPAVVWLTWLALREREVDGGGVRRLVLPRDYRPLVEAVYGEGAAGAGGALDAGDRARLGEKLLEAEARRLTARQKAQQRLTPEPKTNVPLTEGRKLAFEEDEEGEPQGWGSAATRDGEPTISVVPLFRTSNGLVIMPAEEAIGREPERETQLRLLRRSFRVGHQAMVAAADELRRATPGWREVALLRNVVPLVLDEEGRATVGETAVRLDRELGLLIGAEAMR